MGFLHFCIWTEGVITIGRAVLTEEGKDTELDPAMVLAAYEWNWPIVSTVTFFSPRGHMALPNINGEGKKKGKRTSTESYCKSHSNGWGSII